MILLKNLKLNNFLSYKKEEISFPLDSQISIEGVSGAGKSSVVDAIIWALFGKSRCENRNLVHSGAKNCTVTLELTDDDKGNGYIIERTVTRDGKQTIQISESVRGGEYEPIKRTGLKDHQLWIEKELLHSSYTLFINSIAYPQENSESFVKQTASKRKDLLLEIARTEDYDMYYNRAKDRAQLLTEVIARATTLLDVHKKSILDATPIADKESTYSDQKTSLETEIGSKQLVLGALNEEIGKLDVLRSKLLSLASMRRGIEVSIRDNQEWVRLKEDEIKKLSDLDITKIDLDIAKLVDLRKKLTELEEIDRYNSIRQVKLTSLISNKPIEYDHDSTIKELNRKLIDVMSHGNVPCPDGKHCRCFLNQTKGNSDDIEKMLEETMKKKMIQEEAMKDFGLRLKDIGEPQGDGQTYAHIIETRREIDKLLPSEKLKDVYSLKSETISKIKVEIDKINEQISSYLKQYDDIKKEESDVQNTIMSLNPDKIKIELDSVSSLLATLEKKKDECIMKLSEARNANAQILKSTIELSKLNEEITKNNESLECILYVKDAFGSKGIKTIVIDYLIPRLEDTINDILGKMSDFRVKLETQKKAVDGESVVDGLFISVFNEVGDEFEFSSYSGGEKMRISVAISEALASVQNVGFRIFDEVFVGLNEALTDSFAAVMVSLQAKFKQILCISHLRIIQDRFQNKLVVTKENNTSSVNYV